MHVKIFYWFKDLVRRRGLTSLNKSTLSMDTRTDVLQKQQSSGVSIVVIRVFATMPFGNLVVAETRMNRFSFQKWNLQKSACDDGVKIELRPVLAQFGA